MQVRSAPALAVALIGLAVSRVAQAAPPALESSTESGTEAGPESGPEPSPRTVPDGDASSGTAAPAKPPASDELEPSADGLPNDPFVAAGVQSEAPALDRAPSARTHGRVVAQIFELGARTPVENAVVLGDDGQRIEADAEGRVALWLTPGEHVLELRAPAYQPARFVVRVEVGVEQSFEYRLEEDLDAPRYYTLVESRREVAISKTTLRDEEIHDVAGTRGDPFAVVKSLPGAAQVAGFLPYVVVRGAAPGNTGYYLDGSRVPLLFHVAVGPSVVHPYFIDAVDFYPGGAPVRLGRYTNGIIEGRTAEPQRDRVTGEVDLRVTDAGALLHIPWDRRRPKDCTAKRKRDCEKEDARGTLTVAGRYSYTGLLLSAIPALDIRLAFWDYQARLDHDIGPRATYRAFVYGSYDSIGPREPQVVEIVPADPDDPNSMGEVQEITQDPDPFLRFYFHRIDQRIFHRVREDTQGIYALTLGLDQTGVGEIKTNEWRVAPRITFVKTLSSQAELGFGLDQEFQVFKLDRDLADIDPAAVEDLSLFLSERFVSVTGLWTDLRWRRGRVELRPGIRVDAYAQVGPSPVLPSARSRTSAFGVDPRLSVREELNERWTLKQSIGMYHQPPSPPIPLPGIESLGFDRGLQRNIQGSFGYEWQIGTIGSLSQEAYLGRLSNLQDYEFAQTDEFETNEFEDFIVRVTGWAYGLETMLKLDPRRRVYGWIAYTLSRSTRDFRVGGSVPSPWDQTHLLNLVLGYKIGHKWRLGGRLHYNSGRPYTAISPGQTVGEALAENRNNRRLPGFFQLDARFERIFVRDKWRLHMYLDVTNATLSREIFACGGSGGLVNFGGGGELAEDSPSQSPELAGCVDPQGLRYILPSVGMRGVF